MWQARGAMKPLRILPEDLAPGDARARDVDWSTLRLERVGAAEHPLFERAYGRLWREFGAAGEMERREVIAERLAWDRPVAGHTLRYELLAVLSGPEIVGLRDHTAIVPPRRPDGSRRVVVHLSHVVVEPALRGGGLSGWLRALPLQLARECAAAAGGADDPITLVGEMEPADGVTPAVMARLRSYDRAGFLEVDPAVVRYHQPDFRPPAQIDATSLRPVPLALVLRRVGDEAATSLRGDELRELLTALYTMFGVHLRPEDMAPLWSQLRALPGPAASVPLLPLLR